MSINNGRIDLCENAGAGNKAAKECKGGRYYLMAEATWGGGNIKLQFQTPNGTWIDVPSSTLSANNGTAIELPQGQIRAVVTTATAVYAYLVGIPQ